MGGRGTPGHSCAPLAEVGLLEPTCLDEAGPGTSEEEVLPPGARGQELSTLLPQNWEFWEGVPSSGAGTSEGVWWAWCWECGKKPETGINCWPGKWHKSLPPPPASGGSPSRTFYGQTHWGAGWKRRNCGSLSPSPGSTEQSTWRWIQSWETLLRNQHTDAWLAVAFTSHSANWHCDKSVLYLSVFHSANTEHEVFGGSWGASRVELAAHSYVHLGETFPPIS